MVGSLRDGVATGQRVSLFFRESFRVRLLLRKNVRVIGLLGFCLARVLG